jgi:hypothetical protein
MRSKYVYLPLCFLGGLLPLRHLVLFLTEQGFDSTEAVRQIYATRMGAFFTADVVASLVVFIAFAVIEGRRSQVPRYWLSFLGLIIGVSLAFPLFLFMREKKLESTGAL